MGANYNVAHQAAEIFYLVDQNRWPGLQDGLTLFEQPIAGTDCDLCSFVVGDLAASEADYAYQVVGADATIDIVQIGNITGQYVEGNWQAQDNRGMKWFDDPYRKYLRFQKNGMAFELVYTGMDIGKDELIAIAESIP